MDTDQCIQRLVRTEPEGSDHAQHKIEDATQYWVMKEKEAATNYCHVLELNKSVSDKRVQQLYSQDQTQEVIPIVPSSTCMLLFPHVLTFEWGCLPSFIWEELLGRPTGGLPSCCHVPAETGLLSLLGLLIWAISSSFDIVLKDTFLVGIISLPLCIVPELLNSGWCHPS